MSEADAGPTNGGDDSSGSGDFTYDVFISYATANQDDAMRIVRRLEDSGLKCWIAPRNIRPGIEYGAEIINGIRKSKTLVVLISSVSVTSQHVRAEVERAVSLGHTVYPVRLEDVEVGDALEFFLSIRQRIDIFDDPAGQNIKVLADAIASNAAPEQIALKPPRPAWRKWALPAAVAGAVLAAFLFLFDMISSRMEMSRAAKYQEQQLEKSLEAASELTKKYQDQMMGKDAPVPDLSALNLTVNGWAGNYTVTLTPDSAKMIAYNRELEYSIDGGPFQSMRFNLRTDGTFEKLVIRLVDGEGNELTRADITDKVRAQLDGQIVDAFRKELESRDYWECSIGGCSFKSGRESSICSPAIDKMEVRQNGKSKWTELPRPCEDESTAYQPVCYSYADLPFPLEEGKPVNVRVTFSSGTTFETELPLVLDPLSFSLRGDGERNGNKLPPSFDQWVTLEPVRDRNPDGPAPIAMMAFEAPQNIVGRYQLKTGLAACSRNGQGVVQSNGWLMDEDGKGLIRMRSLRFGPNFRPHRPEDIARYERFMQGEMTIGMAADLETGERAGPYYYRFDPKEPIALAARRYDTAVECGSNRFRQLGQSCEAAKPIAWIGAEKVEFGPSADDLSVSYEIDYTVEDYVLKDCPYDATECEPFLFAIPEDWDNVYYRITDHKGETYPIERVMIERR